MSLSKIKDMFRSEDKKSAEGKALENMPSGQMHPDKASITTIKPATHDKGTQKDDGEGDKLEVVAPKKDMSKYQAYVEDAPDEGERVFSGRD